MAAPTTRPPVSDKARAELRAAVERLCEQWSADPTEDLAGHITDCFRDWRPDRSAVGLWCMWLRFEESGDVDALLEELIGDRS